MISEIMNNERAIYEDTVNWGYWYYKEWLKLKNKKGIIIKGWNMDN